MAPDRLLRWSLAAIAIAGLAVGLLALAAGMPAVAPAAWTAATLPVAAGLAVGIARDLAAGRLGVDAIALLSMTAALVLGQPLAGAVVALMYAGGNVLEDIAVTRARSNLAALIDRAPRRAHRRVDDHVEDIAVGEVAVGDRLLVPAGEVVPVDGVVAAGSATLDESAITGEAIAVTKIAGAAILSGALNAGDAFTMTAVRPAGESTYAGIVRLVTAAQTAKARFVRLADRYALVFLPVTVIVAAIAWRISGDPIRALAVAVAATPCPLILAAPVAFIAGVAQAARRGILVKGGGPLEALARAHTVLFDKTGTLTVGGARLLSIEAAPGHEPEEVLELAATLEQASHHVLAEAVVAAVHERRIALRIPSDIAETLGLGVSGAIDGRRVVAGSRELVFAGMPVPDWATRAARRAAWRSALAIFVSADGQPIGGLTLADELRAEAPRAIRLLRRAGVARVVMLTGDRLPAAEAVGAGLDLDAVLADRTPAEKVDAVRVEQRLNPTVMVGDGINDAPALAAADVGIALGARGASASSQAADVVVVADRIDLVGEAIAIAQRARRIAIESILAGMSLSGLAMLAALVGWLAPVPAAIAQEAIDVAVILNALRALQPPRRRRRRRLPAADGHALHRDHLELVRKLNRLREIADRLDAAPLAAAPALIADANRIIQEEIVAHERDDEADVYPRLARLLADGYGLSAMSRAHREILHLAGLLVRITGEMRSADADQPLIRDAQRTIEAIEALVRVHTAQEDDIYDAVLDPAA
jgi:heavy metal translocating P-type ATPase